MTMRRLAPILRPRSRRKLPEELRAENVGRLAGNLPEGVRDPGFESLLRRIDQSPIHHGNAVTVFHRGEEAFQLMRRAIENASEEVLLESYIFRDDETGRGVRDLLVEAASRGVRVRVLADAFGSFTTRSTFWEEMRAAGVEVRLFHPFLSHFWFQFFRDHRKILVVDRRIAFTGGMNIAVEYGSPRVRGDARTWRDTHLRVEGPAAWELAVVFSESWQRARGSRFEVPPLEVNGKAASGASVLVLDSRPLRGHKETAAALAAIVGAARRSILITNAYFAPRWVAIEILGAAARRGVDVRLLLPGQSDLPLVRHAGHGYFDALLERGVRLFEYKSSVLHAKSLVADGFVSVVGSTNLDVRSFRFNAECNLLILDETVGSGMERAFAEDLSHSEEIRPETWRRRGVRHRWADALARRLNPLL
jgi:cardiolipin synthase